jgi:hypothetical protein
LAQGLVDVLRNFDGSFPDRTSGAAFNLKAFFGQEVDAALRAAENHNPHYEIFSSLIACFRLVEVALQVKSNGRYPRNNEIKRRADPEILSNIPLNKIQLTDFTVSEYTSFPFHGC